MATLLDQPCIEVGLQILFGRAPAIREAIVEAGAFFKGTLLELKKTFYY